MCAREDRIGDKQYGIRTQGEKRLALTVMKKISLLKSLLAVALGSWVAVAVAQNLPKPLVAAAQKAVETNPEVQARWHAFLAAAEEKSVAQGGLLPQIDLAANIGRESKVAAPSAGGNFGTYNFATADLNLRQMLFDGGLTSNEITRLSHAQLTRYYELLEASEQVALASVQAYADVVAARELVDTAKENYVIHKQTAMQVDERFRAGVGRGADSEQANGRLALAESSLLTELTKLNDANARYLNVLGELPASDLRPLPDPFKLGTMPKSILDALIFGLPNNPALNAAVENARAKEAEVSTKQSAFLPRIDARAYANRGNNAGGYRGNSLTEGVQLALTYNIYRGGSDVARTRQANALRDQSLQLKEKACRDARQTLSIAYHDVKTLDEQLAYLDQHRLSTEKAREAYRSQFDIGQRTLLDLLDTQNEYFAANQAYISARYKQVAAQARTLAVSGQLVSTLGVSRKDQPTAQQAGQSKDALSTQDICAPTSPIELVIDKTVPAPVAKAAPPKPPVPPSSYVVLVPNPDGSVGEVDVTTASGVTTLKQALDAAVLDGTGKTFKATDAQVKGDFDPAHVHLPALPEQFRLYFNLDSASLTKDSTTELPKVIDAMKQRQAPDVSVVGHTDTVGSAKYNRELGLKRANAVADKIRAEGLNDVEVSVQSEGEEKLLVPTKDGVAEPMNRRVEITVR